MIAQGPDRAERSAEWIEEAEFLANVDRYVDAGEAGQEFILVRDGAPILRLGPAER